MSIEEEIFEGARACYDKLLSYGFIKEGSNYIYKHLINNDKFQIIITVDNTGDVKGKIVDLKLGEEYSGFRQELLGTFSGMIKNDFIELLNNIKEKCFEFYEKVNSWVIPANIKIFDIIEYFNHNDEIDWHQSIKAEVNDYVYIYVGSPYSAIMYKCIVTKINFLGYGKYRMENCMHLKLISKFESDEYPLDFLKKCGLTNIRFARRIPNILSNYLYER